MSKKVLYESKRGKMKRTSNEQIVRSSKRASQAREKSWRETVKGPEEMKTNSQKQSTVHKACGAVYYYYY